MSPNAHPHGGGEGRAPIGRTRPLTPWGKPALGMKTRKRKKLSRENKDRVEEIWPNFTLTYNDNDKEEHLFSAFPKLHVAQIY